MYRRITLAIVVILVLAPFGGRLSRPPVAAAAGGGDYRLTDLGTLGGPASYANGINGEGEIVGWATTAANIQHAFLWRGGQMLDLHPYLPTGARSSMALAINDSGQAVGSFVAPDETTHAFTWDGTRMLDLGPGVARAINAAGVVVGEQPRGTSSRAVLWRGTQVSDLSGALGVGASAAVAISAGGEVAGTWTAPGADPQGFLYSGGSARLLPRLGETRTMNDRGVVAGSRISTDGMVHGVLYDYRTDELNELGTFNTAGSYVAALNNRGHAVGTASYSRVFKAFLYRDGAMLDLNDALPADSGWDLAWPMGINDAGQIVGGGGYPNRAYPGPFRAFLLTPVVRVALSTTSLSFAAQAVGTASASQSVTLTNPGVAPLVASVAVTGDGAGDFAVQSACPPALAPGAACTLAVRFLPAGVGARAATLLVTDSGDGAQYPVALTGTGQIPAGVPSPTPSLSPVPTPAPGLIPAPSSTPSPAPGFADVPDGYWARDQIGTFAQRKITTGCGDNDLGQRLYCPERGVSRAEMATFLVRALGQAGQTPPATPTFADVPTDHWAYGAIEAFARLGITTGCGLDARGHRLFCPERGVTRAEMAAFLDRAQGQTELAAATPTFADVPAGYWAYGWIERFFTLGVTTGCGEDGQGTKVYCPNRGVTRAEMAVFITRAYP